MAQLSIAQFYNPEFLRGYGVGVLNGSLWTIPIELQFYLILPLIIWVLDRLRPRRALLVVLFVLLVAVNQVYVHFISSGRSLPLKLFGVTVVPYLYMFVVGVIVQRNRSIVRRYLANRAAMLLGAYIALSFVMWLAGVQYGGNYLNPVSAIMLSLLMISFAYSYTGKLHGLLSGRDLSYGVYIYHMIWVNALIHLSLLPSWWNLCVMLAVTLVAAYISWTFVEKPSLALKAYPTKRLAGSPLALETDSEKMHP